MSRPTAQLELADRWDVHRCDSVFGVGKKLATIEAPDRAAAELVAREKHGPHILVTVAGGARKTRPDHWQRRRWP